MWFHTLYLGHSTEQGYQLPDTLYIPYKRPETSTGFSPLLSSPVDLMNRIAL